MKYSKNIVCPTCNSNSISIILENNDKDYNICGGILGYLILGPIGMICGICNVCNICDENKSKLICMCNNCGCRFLRNN